MCKKKVPILDTAAVITKIVLQLPTKQYTVPQVINEVRDRESLEALESAQTTGKLIIKNPSQESLVEAARAAEKIGEKLSLSETDLAVMALALDFKKEGFEPIIYTDDYSLQNLAKSLGIGFHPIRTRGIIRKRKYITYCTACGYVAVGRNERICPRCGHKLTRKPIS